MTKAGMIQYHGFSGNFGKQMLVSIGRNVFAKFEFSAVLRENNIIYVWGYDKKSFKINVKSDEVPKHVELAPFGTYVLCESNYLYFFDVENEKYCYSDIISVAASRTKAILLKKDGRVFTDMNGKLIQVPGITDVPIKVFGGGAHF